MVEVSIVIPAYNEEKRLPETLSSILAFLQNASFSSEIIVVDDGSTDRTADIALSFPPVRVLRNKQNMGKGATVAHGMLAAAGRYVLFTDADGSTPIEEVNGILAAHRQGYDVVVGSRALKESEIVQYQPAHRVLLGRLFNLAVRLFAIPGIHDTQCGFKSFTHDAAQAVFSRRTIDRWGFDVETLFIARRLGYRIKEVAIQWKDSPNTKVNAVKDGLRMLADIFKVRYQDMQGLYQ